jgi:hypothetical protein
MSLNAFWGDGEGVSRGQAFFSNRLWVFLKLPIFFSLASLLPQPSPSRHFLCHTLSHEKSITRRRDILDGEKQQQHAAKQTRDPLSSSRKRE